MQEQFSALESATAYSPVLVSSVKVPQYGVYGENAKLHCKYTSVQPVYSVKWYKNGLEFFRYRGYELTSTSKKKLLIVFQFSLGHSV